MIYRIVWLIVKVWECDFLVALEVAIFLGSLNFSGTVQFK
jgi:hypothetical protein